MIEFASTSYTKHPNPFWRQERRILPAGFKPVQEFPVGTKIYRGAWIQVLPGLTCAVIKVAKVLTGGTTTKPRVAKDGYFQVGDTVMDLSNDAKTTTIKSIDTSNPDYDVLTLNAAISTLAEGHFIQEAIDYGYIDLKLQNNSEHSVYLECRLVDNTLYATFWGYKSDSYDQIVICNQDGGNNESDTAFYATAWREYYKDGVMIGSEELPSSKYVIDSAHAHTFRSADNDEQAQFIA